MQLHLNHQNCLDNLKGIIEIQHNKLKLINNEQLKNELDNIIYTAIFSTDKQLRNLCKYIIREAAKLNNCIPCSIYDFYIKLSKETTNFTIPAINIRTLTYEIAQEIFKICKQLKAAAVIFESARSEISYTNQVPSEYSSCILAAALKQDYHYPIFIQGDHFQINRNEFFLNKDKEIKQLESLIKNAIDSKFYNIDIDASTLVNIEEKEEKKQQLLNYEMTAYFIDFIRKNQPSDIIINIGAEIGEIGKKNSTTEDLDAFLEGLNNKLKSMNIQDSITKISIQTGTTHGGFVLPDGTLAEVNIDFDTIKKLSKISKEKYNLAGVVQHGASTLPKDLFHKFPENNCVEIHLATEFQNIILDHPAFPTSLKEEINKWIKNNYKEKALKITDEQLIYKRRKNALGPFKRQIWDIDTEAKKEILKTLSSTFEFIFKMLNIKDTADEINKIIKPVTTIKELN